jgi:hypothetical protein
MEGQMTRTLWTIAFAALAFVVILVSVRNCRDNATRETDAVATSKVDAGTAAAEAERDTIGRLTPGAQRADSDLSSVLDRPRPPAPVVRVLVDTVAGAIDSSRWVPLSVHVADSLRYDSLSVAARAYRDSSRALLVRYPRLVAAQDSVIKYQRVLLDHPRPRRRWGLGCAGGYGAASTGGTVRVGPALACGLSYSL